MKKSFFAKVRDFFFPRNFIGEAIKGFHEEKKRQKRERRLIVVGQKLMLERRGKKWVDFWMWIPIMGNYIFLKEARKKK